MCLWLGHGQQCPWCQRPLLTPAPQPHAHAALRCAAPVAPCAVKSAEEGGKLAANETRLRALVEVSSLIFVAEWGDRSMLATIALGAAQSPLGEHAKRCRCAFCTAPAALLCGTTGVAGGIRCACTRQPAARVRADPRSPLPPPPHIAGVAGGAILAHALATLIAVVGGAMLSKHISERTVGILGGTLFLVFAAATVFGFF